MPFRPVHILDCICIYHARSQRCTLHNLMFLPQGNPTLCILRRQPTHDVIHLQRSPSLPRNLRTSLLLYAPKNLAACATCSSLKLAMKKYEWS